MPLIIGIDLGTTKTTAIAVDIETGEVLSRAATRSEGQTTAPVGRSEWDTNRLLRCAFGCLQDLTKQLESRSQSVVAIGVTGQQHGGTVVDVHRKPLTPFINWQDQRGNEPADHAGGSWVDAARRRIEPCAPLTGCRLNTGFLATTLFWMRQNDCLPSGRAAFLADLFVSELTDTAPVSEPSMAGSAGVFDVTSRTWHSDAIRSLDLPLSLFPPVHEVGSPAGPLERSTAELTGLPAGIPVAPAIGDHQAGFLGSVANHSATALLNVGTGAQIAVYTDSTAYEPPVELRPFPLAGQLLSNVGLPGGWSFQVIENLVRDIGCEVFDATVDQPLYDRLTELAARADVSGDGLTCIPTFSGTRQDPAQRGSLTGMSPDNLTAANLFASVLNGMADSYRTAWDQVVSIAGVRQTQLVGAGNGLRKNPVLASAVERRFGLPVSVTAHREEAAFGAALAGAVACGVWPSLEAAGSMIRYQ